ncbi:DnaJ homolog subfamily A member 4 [Eumeta japonica]|nr:DnaJ homolog subfamily A member 4 [Eumeta japonica]
MDEGMPLYKNPLERVVLLYSSVIFPDTIPVSVIPQIEQCLPPRPEITIPLDAEHVNLDEFDPKQRRDQQQHRMAYDEDERFDGVPRVQQCSTN